MPKFVIDEDMPRSTGKILKEHGYDVKDLERFKDLSEEDFRGNVIIIETAKMRIRRR